MYEEKIDVFFAALRENLKRHHADKALELAMDEAEAHVAIESDPRTDNSWKYGTPLSADALDDLK